MTRLEKLEASLERERRKADLKRIKQARDYMRLGLEALKNQFHDGEFENHAFELRPQLAEDIQELTVIIEGE